MRGTHHKIKNCTSIIRITPAHAGNTFGATGWRVLPKDHPRTCGEHCISIYRSSPKIGSPPHMRGTHRYCLSKSVPNRITPAHAGNTRLFVVKKNSCEDHPRTCGEHGVCVYGRKWEEGSPPHMRGTLTLRKGNTVASRITPAHAGNTRAHYAWTSLYQDHPRTCGEHVSVMWFPFSTSGSPPHMRGTRCMCVWTQVGRRITPAHAGNTSPPLSRVVMSWDHPRTCGEHFFHPMFPLHLWGSPPHMRGTPPDEVLASEAVRITPAHAGNTVNS